MQRRLSVVVPVFNAESYLDACLRSVCGQTFRDLEVVCVDDGSVDRSGGLLEAWARRDPRVRVLRQANAGQGAARNRGLAAATGEYVYFMDADDELADGGAFAYLVGEMSRDRLDVLLFDAETRSCLPEGPRVVDTRLYDRRREYAGVRSGADLFAAMRGHREFSPSPCLFVSRRDLLAGHGFAFREDVYHEDNLFTIDVLLAASRASHRRRRLYRRYVRENSTMTKAPTTAHLRGLLCCCRQAEARIADAGLARGVRRGLRDLLFEYRWKIRRMVRAMGVSRGELPGGLSPEEEAVVRDAAVVSVAERIAAARRCLHDRGIRYVLRRILFGRGGAE